MNPPFRRMVKNHLKNIQRGDYSLQYQLAEKGIFLEEWSARAFLKREIKGRTIYRLAKGARKQGKFVNLGDVVFYYASQKCKKQPIDFRAIKFTDFNNTLKKLSRIQVAFDRFSGQVDCLRRNMDL